MKSKVIFSLLLLFVLGLIGTSSMAQDDETNALDFIPPSRFITGWEASGNEMIAGPMRAAWLIADDLDLLLEFDLLYYATETYTQGHDDMSIEIFEFNSASDAYGFYSLSYIELPDPDAIDVTTAYEAPPAATVETIRRVMVNGEEYIEAYQDRFYLRIKTTETYLDLSGTKAALYMLARMPGVASPAGFIGILPYEGRVVGTERYFLGPFGLDKIMPTNYYDLFGDYQYEWKAAAAEYRAGSGDYYLLIGVEYDDADIADIMKGSLMDYFEELGYEPLRLRPFDSGILPYGYVDEYYIALWADGDNLWLIWDAGNINALNTALDQQ